MALPYSPPADALPPCAGGGAPGPSEFDAAAAHPGLAALVKACTGQLGAKRVGFVKGMDYFLFELPDGATRAQLEGIEPDFSAMTSLVPPGAARGVIVTARGGKRPRRGGRGGGAIACEGAVRPARRSRGRADAIVGAPQLGRPLCGSLWLGRHSWRRRRARAPPPSPAQVAATATTFTAGESWLVAPAAPQRRSAAAGPASNAWRGVGWHLFGCRLCPSA